jgi:hypothetical protein
LRGQTTGYRRHPQVERFRECGRPVAAIAAYLRAIHAEACRRGYSFDEARIRPARGEVRLTVTRGQIEYEWTHLKRKLRARDQAAYRRILVRGRPTAHPLFRIVPGALATWERQRRAVARRRSEN